MNPPLQGQTAIVTGAGSPAGIGFAIARHLFREGAFVAIGATSERIHDAAKQLDPSGERVFPFVADLTEEARAQKVVEEIAQRTGTIDILVNNAGMAQNGMQPGITTVEKISYADYEEAEVRPHCECDVGNGTVGEQLRFRRVWRGQRRDGRVDAGRGD